MKTRTVYFIGLGTVLLLSQCPSANFEFRLPSSLIQLPFALGTNRTLSVDLEEPIYIELLFHFYLLYIGTKVAMNESQHARQIIYSV